MAPHIEKKKKKAKGKRKPGKGQKKHSGAPHATFRPSIGGNGASLVEAYRKTLEDPFQYGPVRLGFGTMVPTVLATAYCRVGTLTTNADGSFGLFQFPSIGTTISGLFYNSSGLASTNWVGVAYPNGSTILTAMGSARVVSAGLRLRVLQAATESPGIIYSGLLPRGSVDSLITTTPTQFMQLPGAEWSSSQRGVSVRWRPVDNTSYELSNLRVIGSSTALDGSIPFIALAGFPASTRVMLEAIINLEGVATTKAQTMTTGDAPQPGLSDYVPSLDGLWSTIKGKLTNAVFETSDLDTLNNAVNNLGSHARAARDAYNWFKESTKEDL